MAAGGFELVANEPQPQQPGAEGVLFIVAMGPGVGGALLHQRLMADSQAELDIGFDLAGMEGGIEQPELNGALGEYAVQIEPVVPGVVVVVVSPGRAVIPERFQFLHGRGPFLVHLIQKAGVRFLTIVFPFHLDLQGFVEQVLLCRHDVDDVPQGGDRMGSGVHMDVDAAGVVDLGPRTP